MSAGKRILRLVGWAGLTGAEVRVREVLEAPQRP